MRVGRTSSFGLFRWAFLALVWLLPGWMRRAWGSELFETAEARLAEAGAHGRVRRAAARIGELWSLLRVVVEARLYRPEFPLGRKAMFEQDTRPLRTAWVIALVVHFAALSAVVPLGPSRAQAQPERQMTVIKPWTPPAPPPPEIERRTIKRRVSPVPIPDPTPDDPEPIVSELYEYEAAAVELPEAEFVIAAPEAPPQPPQIVRAGAGVRAPQLLERIVPDYPELARRARLECTVVLEARIDRQGNVVDAVPLKPCGLGLTEAALEAVGRWKYAPTMVNGRPVEVLLAVSLRFELQ